MFPRKIYRQLFGLADAEQAHLQVPQEEDSEIDFSLLDSRLAKAGLLTTRQKLRWLLAWGVFAVILSVLLGALLFSNSVSLSLILSAECILIYLLLLVFLVVLKSKAQRYEQEILFSLPLTVEQLLLLVNSGLGPIPALREVIDNQSSNPITPYLKTIYRRAESGMMFEEVLAEAADKVPNVGLKHFFLHLETSVSQGAELSSSLTQLSEHIHTEWNVTIEGVVRRLESAVVVPVFLSVIGLILLIASVPIVPILELSETMQKNNENMVQEAK